jgi:hypothetical protein
MINHFLIYLFTFISLNSFAQEINQVKILPTKTNEKICFYWKYEKNELALGQLLTSIYIEILNAGATSTSAKNIVLSIIAQSGDANDLFKYLWTAPQGGFYFTGTESKIVFNSYFLQYSPNNENVYPVDPKNGFTLQRSTKSKNGIILTPRDALTLARGQFLGSDNIDRMNSEEIAEVGGPSIVSISKQEYLLFPATCSH